MNHCGIKPSSDVISKISTARPKKYNNHSSNSTSNSSSTSSTSSSDEKTASVAVEVEAEAESSSDAVFSSELELAAWTPLPPSPSLKAKKKTNKKIQSEIVQETMPPLSPIPLLICSIGNPGAAYANTLHSAGHTVINALAAAIQAQPFTKERAYANGAVSAASFSSQQPLWTLFQSPSYMNESGKPIAKAYQAWARTTVGGQGRLVILHDELEKPLGSVSVREGQGLSARGHNGIKSLLQHMGKTEFVRVGLGIGRPVSREANDVAKYVLKKMSPAERERVEGSVGEVVQRLRLLSGG